MKTPTQWSTILEFTHEELAKIDAEEGLEDFRVFYSVITGTLTALAVFGVQGFWYGQPHLIHGYATYGALPAGFLVAFLTPHWIRWYIYRRWRDVWIPLARERMAKKGRGEPVPPARPYTLLELTDRYVVRLTPKGCVGVSMAALWLGILILGPAMMTNVVTQVIWVLAVILFLPISVAMGDLLYRRWRYSSRTDRRYSRLK